MRAPVSFFLFATSTFLACACSSSSGNPSGADDGSGGTDSVAGAAGTGGSSAKGGAGGGVLGGAAGASAASGKGGGVTFGGGGTAGKGGAAAGAGGAGSGGKGGAGGAGPGGKGGVGGAGPGAGGMGMGPGAGGGNPSDPFDKARTLCVDTINKYRATLNLTPYKRWTDNEACVDKEATGDGMAMMAHVSFKNHLCSPAYAQDECPGYGPDPIAALPGCLDQMWNEKDRPACKGCSTCDFPYQNCVDCTFFGTNGTDGCGHYLNMKSAAFTTVACGFWSGGWYAQDFQ